MTSNVIAVPDNRLRPAVVAALITFTFVIGIGAGVALSRVAVSTTIQPVTIGALGAADGDMSSAAYGATHPTAIVVSAPVGTDMSSAAYAATHPTGTDMSSAAYEAMHQH